MKLQLALDFDLSMQDAVEMVKKTEKDGRTITKKYAKICKTAQVIP